MSILNLYCYLTHIKPKSYKFFKKHLKYGKNIAQRIIRLITNDVILRKNQWLAGNYEMAIVK